MTPGAAGKGLLRAGIVAAPHGLDGSFHVVQATPRLLALGGSVLIRDQMRRITRLAGHERRLILRLEGCEDRDAAALLRGAELLVDRSVAPPLEDDEWWAEDLEGCSVHDAGRPVGTVRQLLELPSCEVLEVARADGGGDLLVPLVEAAVRTVDIRARAIDISLAFLGEE
ncbi:MAG: ribosome maturation factor RimM [Solirubrobacteraceae bacterium]